MPDIPKAIRAYFDDVVPPVPVGAVRDRPSGDSGSTADRRGRRAWMAGAAAAAVVLVVITAALVTTRTERLDVGGTGTENQPTTVPGPTVAKPTGTIPGPEALDSLARCAGVVVVPGPDVETPGVDRLANPPDEIIAAVETYGSEHPDDYGGFWVDRTTVGWPIVVGFTSNVEQHRTTVANFVTTLAGPTSWPVQVAYVQLTRDAYGALKNRVLQATTEVNAQLGDPALHATLVNTGWTSQWIVVSVPQADGPAQQVLAQRFAGEPVCFVTPGDGSGIEIPPALPPWDEATAGAIEGA